LLVNLSGSVDMTATYDAYGNGTQSGTASTPIGFAGAYTDAETGFLYLIHRYYDPVTGQFLTVDPDVATTGQAYAFTGDDPVNATDANGLCTNNATWVCQQPAFFYSGATPGGMLSVYRPFFNDLQSGDCLATSLSTLWFGLYQHGQTVTSAGQTLLGRLADSVQTASIGSVSCSGSPFKQFECGVSAIIAYNSNYLGTPDPQAYETFVQDGSQSLAYLAYHPNQKLINVGLAAVSLMGEVYKKGWKVGLSG
jgi:RHS repeat-associated protein